MTEGKRFPCAFPTLQKKGANSALRLVEKPSERGGDEGEAPG
jgi:hypothetical protein